MGGASAARMSETGAGAVDEVGGGQPRDPARAVEEEGSQSLRDESEEQGRELEDMSKQMELGQSPQQQPSATSTTQGTISVPATVGPMTVVVIPAETSTTQGTVSVPAGGACRRRAGAMGGASAARMSEAGAGAVDEVGGGQPQDPARAVEEEGSQGLRDESEEQGRELEDMSKQMELGQSPQQQPSATSTTQGTVSVPATVGPLTVVVIPAALGDVKCFHTKVQMPSGSKANEELMEIEQMLHKGDVENAVEAAEAGVLRASEANDNSEDIMALMTLSRTRRAAADPVGAIDEAAKAYKKAAELEDKRWGATVNLTHAEALEDRGCWDLAREKLEVALATFQEVGDKHHQAVTSMMLSHVRSATWDVYHALKLAKSGLELAAAEEDRDQMGLALLAVANAQCLHALFPDALATAHEALDLARQEGNSVAQASALFVIADIYRSQGSVKQAQKAAIEMRNFCHKAGRYWDEAVALIAIAKVHSENRQGKLAASAASAAGKLCRKRGFKSLLLNALIEHAQGLLEVLYGYANSKQVDAKLEDDIDSIASTANAVLREARRLGEGFGDHRRVALVNLVDSRLMLVWGQDAKALELAGKAKFHFDFFRDYHRAGESCLVLSKAHKKMHPNEKWAANEAFEALVAFQRIKDDDGVYKTYRIMTEVGLAVAVQSGAALPATPAGDAAAPGAAPGGAAAAAGAASALAPATKGLDPEMVTQVVHEQAKAAIGLDDEVYLDSPLMDSGMDSLTAVSFRNNLQQNLAVKLPSSLMFDYPTLKEVSNRIVELSLEDDGAVELRE